MKLLVLQNCADFLGARARWQITLCGLLLIALLGVLDHVTGFEISFSVFYLLPIVLTTWYVGARVGAAMCLLSAVTWLVVDHTSGHSYSQAWIPFWNATTRFAFFGLITSLLVEVKARLRAQQLSARTDPLTGLKNPLALKEEAQLFFNDARRYRYPITLGFIDLDGFKAVNDTRGHAEGDRVLKAVGVTLPLFARASDIVARLGGDEFVVVLPHTGMSDAKTTFGKLHRRLLQAMRDGGWPVSFSIGVAVFTDRMPDFSDALKWADGLMYRVKQSTRNNVIYETFAGAEARAQQVAPPDAHTTARW